MEFSPYETALLASEGDGGAGAVSGCRVDGAQSQLVAAEPRSQFHHRLRRRRRARSRRSLFFAAAAAIQTQLQTAAPRDTRVRRVPHLRRG